MPSLAREERSREQIASATGIVRAVLGDAALAVYLYGSAVAGTLRPDSDLDLLAVSDRSLSRDERVGIVERLLPLSGRHAAGGPARAIELTIVSRPALIPWRYPPSIEQQYGEWLRDKLERGEMPDWPHSDPDVAILIETARRASVALHGRPSLLCSIRCRAPISFGRWSSRSPSSCQGSSKGTTSAMGC